MHEPDFHDALVRDVRHGMSLSQKELPSKYFYDVRGSELFDEITRLDEYYPTRTERAILTRVSNQLIDTARPRTLVELGAGSAEKTRIILDAMTAQERTPTTPITYVPVDVSAEFLDQTAQALRAVYPTVCVEPVTADFMADFTLPFRRSPVLYAFLGSTLGNFTDEAAIALVTRISAQMGERDHFVLGIDLRKDIMTLERAYNDEQGVTAQFNQNILRVINTALGANFDLLHFQHRAIYNTSLHRIEMYLIADRAQCVSIPEVGDVQFRAGEAILTEVSHKYDRAAIEHLFNQTGLTMAAWWTDEQQQFALTLGQPARVHV